MSFASGNFLLFYLVLQVVYWVLPIARVRKSLLLVASYYFYMSWDVEFAGLIAVSTLVDYSVGLVLGSTAASKKRKAALCVSLAVNLGLLAYFKYAGFFVESMRELLSSLGVAVQPMELEIVLPVGISFYTFQTLSYTIDVYRGKLKPTRDLPDFALFVAFFPQLVAGPIVRASEFLPQLSVAQRLQWSRQFAAWQRILIGLAKKIVLADSFALVANQVFSEPEAYGFVGTWCGVLAFALQIYCDFSAYSDIAIGAAASFGYQLPENFRYPYLAGSIREFWRRWHISLSTWLRDYLYISLGGNRRGGLQATRNLMITMFLGGLWHGAAWTFVVWGIFHGSLLAIHRVWSARFGEMTRWLGVPMTFGVVCMGWVLFRAETFGDAGVVFEGMLGVREVAHSPSLRQPVLRLGCVMLLVHLVVAWKERYAPTASWPLTWRVAQATLCAGLIVAYYEGQAEAFIYFQF